MKRILAILVIITAFVLSFNSCTLLSGETIEVKFTLKNSTGYEIESIDYFKPPRFGSSNPNTPVLSPGNGTLKPGEEREFSIWLYKDQLSSGGMFLKIVDMEDTFSDEAEISLDGVKGFEITCDDDMNFSFTAIID